MEMYEESIDDNNDDVTAETFDVIDVFIEAIRKKGTCGLNSMKDLMTGPQLEKLYNEFKGRAIDILQNDLNKCTGTKDIDQKSQ